MAVKSIIDIDINDGPFRAFHAIFQKYSDALAKTPKAWADAAKQGKVALVPFEAAAAALMAQSVHLQRITRDQKTVTSAANATATHWRGIASSTRDAAGNITRATKELLKWTALTSVFTGVLGAGGLFGIDRMAMGVGAGRRSSTGLGVSYGEQKSFGLNFGRLVDGDRFLGGVNEALHDVSKRVGLYGAGMTPGEMGGGTASTAVALLGHLKGIADSTPSTMLSNVMQARQLGQFVSLEDMLRIKDASPAEMARMKADYGRGSTDLNLSSGTQKAWQDFSIQLSRAGEKIENVFIKGLTPLIGPLEQLSKATTDVVKNFLGSDAMKSGIVGAAKGLETFAQYVGTSKFQDDVKDFADGVGTLAAKVKWIANILPGGGSPVRVKVTDPLDWLFPKDKDPAPSQSLWDFLNRPSASSSSQSAVRVVPFYSIRIENNTGGNNNVSANQVSH